MSPPPDGVEPWNEDDDDERYNGVENGRAVRDHIAHTYFQ